MKDESQQQVPPGIVAFKDNPTGIILKQSMVDGFFNDKYKQWVEYCYNDTIHTISVDGKEYSVGDETQYSKILRFVWHNDVWLADTEITNGFYVKKLVAKTEAKPTHIAVAIADIEYLDKRNAAGEIDGYTQLKCKVDLFWSSPKITLPHSPSSPDRSGSQPGQHPDHIPLDKYEESYNMGFERSRQEINAHLATIKALELSCENTIKRADSAEKLLKKSQDEVGRLGEILHSYDEQFDALKYQPSQPGKEPQEFEKYPALAAIIEKVAFGGISPTRWNKLLSEINTALKAENSLNEQVTPAEVMCILFEGAGPSYSWDDCIKAIELYKSYNLRPQPSLTEDESVIEYADRMRSEHNPSQPGGEDINDAIKSIEFFFTRISQVPSWIKIKSALKSQPSQLGDGGKWLVDEVFGKEQQERKPWSDDQTYAEAARIKIIHLEKELEEYRSIKNRLPEGIYNTHKALIQSRRDIKILMDYIDSLDFGPGEGEVFEICIKYKK